MTLLKSNTIKSPLDGTEELQIRNSLNGLKKESRRTTTQDIADLVTPAEPYVAPYLSWVANVGQAGTTAAPTVPVLFYNTLGVTLTPSREGLGDYLLTAPSAVFTANKTAVFNTCRGLQRAGLHVATTRLSDTEISISCVSIDGVPVDGFEVLLEIRVYS